MSEHKHPLIVLQLFSEQYKESPKTDIVKISSGLMEQVIENIDAHIKAIREHEKRSRQYYGDHGTVPPQRDLDLWKTLEVGL